MSAINAVPDSREWIPVAPPPERVSAHAKPVTPTWLALGVALEFIELLMPHRIEVLHSRYFIVAWRFSSRR